MLPPVDDAVLQNNPQFESLYKTLTTAVLNPDGSTKNDPAGKEREAVREQLGKHRHKHLKQSFLISALSTANPTESAPKPTLRRPRTVSRQDPAPSSSDPTTSTTTSTPTLPPDLLDLLALLPILLAPETATTLSAESATLLLSNPPITTLPAHLPALASLLSPALQTPATLLARQLHPGTNPSFQHRAIAALPTSTAALQARLASGTALLARQRSDAGRALARLLALTAEAVVLLVRVLEAKHGNVARSLQLRSAEVALVAARRAAEADGLLVGVRAAVYRSEAVGALEGYAAHLRDGKIRLREEVRGLRDVLAGYGVAVGGEDGDGDEAGDGRGRRPGTEENKERTMREMARVYRDMSRQLEEVRGDLERLGRA